MSDTTRDLLISLASHMAYMQGQLEARHELDDPDDYYWYRESVLLRQKVADHLAAEAQQPSSGLPELRSSPPTVMEIIELSEKAEAAGLGQVDFARAALADGPAVPHGREPASVTEQPSDEEIMGLMPQQMHEDLAYAARAMANEAGTDNRKAKGFMRIALNRHAVDLARAVLARWGRPAPAPPADGEVAELVRMLTGIAHWRRRGRPGECDPSPFDIRQADRLDRAAELLQRQALVPLPEVGQ